MVLDGEVTASESVASDESEGRHVVRVAAPAAIDIVVRWGDWIMTARELSPPRSFFVGEEGCDVTLPAEMIGAQRVPVLLTRWDGDVRIVVPNGARILLGGQTKRLTAARAIARGFAKASSTVRDAAEVSFLPGQTATLFFGAVAIDLHATDAAPQLPRTPLVERRFAWWQFASFLLHALIVGALVFIGPPLRHEDYGMSAAQLDELQRRLWRLEEKEAELRWDVDAYEWRARRNERRRRAELAAQQTAWMDSLEPASHRWSDALAAEARRDEAPDNGNRSLIGLLYDWPAPAAPARESRPVTVTFPGDTRPPRGRGPQVRMGATSVSGRLPPEVIQRIVRQNFGRFRVCYENGLRNNPNLQGRVGVRFVIGRDGAVSNTGNGGSDMPDSGVVSCVVRSFQSLSFPQPESGIVTVVYPIMFSPGD